MTTFGKIQRLEKRILLVADLSVSITVDPVQASVQAEVRVTNGGDEFADGIDIEISTSLKGVSWKRVDETQRQIVFDANSLEFEVDDGLRIPHARTSAGDFDGDGRVDVAGTGFEPESGGLFGQVVFNVDEPPVGLFQSAVLRILPPDDIEWRSGEIRPAGDFNDDGVDDLILVAREFDGLGRVATRAYVIFGNESLEPGGDISVASLDGSNGFKLSVDADNLADVDHAGDFNGDGINDIVVVTTVESDFADGNAEGYVVFGGQDVGVNGELDLLDFDQNDGLVLEPSIDGERPAKSIAGIGDTNGDGYDDVVFGNVVVYGGQDGFVQLGDEDGYSIFPPNQVAGQIVGAGDVNDDGFADILIHELGDFPSQVAIVFGAEETARSFHTGELENQGRTVKITGVYPWGPGNEIGLASAGDFNADGFDDILIGSPGDSGASIEPVRDAGTAFFVYGGSNLPRTINAPTDLRGDLGFEIGANRSSADTLHGRFVSSLGDINQDGFDDIVVNSVNVLLGHSNGQEVAVTDTISRLHPGASVTYTISADSPVEGFEFVATAHDRDRVDATPENNRASFAQAPLPGDVNLDGEVSFADFLILSMNFGNVDSERSDGDLNDDALVSFEDFLILTNDFGNSISAG